MLGLSAKNRMSEIRLDSPHSFGGLLCLLRQRARLTQREFAAKVAYSEAQINRFEKGLGHSAEIINGQAPPKGGP